MKERILWDERRSSEEVQATGERDSEADYGAEFTARKVRSRLERLAVQTMYIEPRSPWENGI